MAFAAFKDGFSLYIAVKFAEKQKEKITPEICLSFQFIFEHLNAMDYISLNPLVEVCFEQVWKHSLYVDF